MRVLIVDDEFAAQANLRTLLTTRYKDIEVVGVADSIATTVEWLQNNETDVIFMDVELSDGTCFEIFRQVDITAKVIITTAYDNYAIRAFRVNSIDYLLKPIDPALLDEAVQKCRQTQQEVGGDKPVNLEDLNAQIFKPFYTESNLQTYRQRFVVRIGDKYIIIKAEDIAYFFSQEKTSYLMTLDGKQYVYDKSLDMVESLLDPAMFFRVNRAYIANINAITVIFRHFSGRLKLQFRPPVKEDVFVSRVRVSEFMHWINQ